MNSNDSAWTQRTKDDKPNVEAKNGDKSVLPSTSYDQIGQAIRENRTPILQDVTQLLSAASHVQPPADPEDSPITITNQQKLFALAIRESNRAFNGAPPTVPHPIDQFSNQSCMVCHGVGLSLESLRIPKMSHQYLENCTQCHVEAMSRDLPEREFSGTTFVGLPAPTGGPRAFPNAPPQIPHSTWMRSSCMSCHGPTGQFGIRTTHPWRSNCQQCHAPSSLLDQIQLDSQPNFLPPIKIIQSDNE